MATLGKELSSPPSDGISDLRFSPSSADLLLCASWDKHLRLYDVGLNVTRNIFKQQGALLSCCFVGTQHAAAGGLEGHVKRYDLESGAEALLGSHGAAVSALEYEPSSGVVLSAGWDAMVNAWDPRAPSGRPTATVALPGKAYSMSLGGTHLVVATSGRRVVIVDAGRGLAVAQSRESPLKYQSRCVRCHPDGTGFALSSVEGRVAVESVSQSESAMARRYAFKCHRVASPGGDIVHPVHALAYHPVHGTFASGGGDGVVSIWDGDNKKRLCHYPTYPTSVAALAFNATGTSLAVGSSYAYEAGERPHPPDAIYIRDVTDTEVKPKAKLLAGGV